MTYTPYICEWCEKWGPGCYHGGCVGMGDRGRKGVWAWRKKQGWSLLKRIRYFNVTRPPA